MGGFYGEIFTYFILLFYFFHILRSENVESGESGESSESPLMFYTSTENSASNKSFLKASLLKKESAVTLTIPRLNENVSIHDAHKNLLDLYSYEINSTDFSQFNGNQKPKTKTNSNGVLRRKSRRNGNNNNGDYFEEEDERVRGRDDLDIVTRYLQIVETQQGLGANCRPGTALSLGPGIVPYDMFRYEAEIAVNRANFLTRLWKYAGNTVTSSEYFLHASLISMIEMDEDIFAAGNCYNEGEYKGYKLFCPYAYRLLPSGSVHVKNLAEEYYYVKNSSEFEWFHIAKSKAERVIKNQDQFKKGYRSSTFNESAHTQRVPDEILFVTYEDGNWSKPYFDCGGGNIWMLTFTVPFFGYLNNTYYFKGTSGIDIDLRRVDIDQCSSNSTELNIFAGSSKCKKTTTVEAEKVGTLERLIAQSEKDFRKSLLGPES